MNYHFDEGKHMFGDRKEASLEIHMDGNSADGEFKICGGDFSMAELFWADAEGKALPGWTSFAYVPLKSGKGLYTFSGSRAIPKSAAAVLCRMVSEDGSRTAECSQVLPGRYCFVAASDLHISNKAGPFDRLYDFAAEADGLLLAGDTVNDGTEQQFEFVKGCIMNQWEKRGKKVPLYTVAGNHDIPLKPLPLILKEEQGGYPMFQKWIRDQLKPAEAVWEQDVSGAYAVSVGADIEIIGLQCVSHFRRFVFRDGRQLQWLEEHLNKRDDLRWHIILCHAPLLRHNPQRRKEGDPPYLSRDKVLQDILDRHHHIIFISGHTHFSLSNRWGCADWDASRSNLYLNTGSIRKTTMKSDGYPVPAAWTEGCAVLLRISDQAVEITTVGLYSGNKQARGYYDIKVT